VAILSICGRQKRGGLLCHHAASSRPRVPLQPASLPLTAAQRLIFRAWISVHR